MIFHAAPRLAVKTELQPAGAATPHAVPTSAAASAAAPPAATAPHHDP